MAEHKRHMDVPQERFLEGALPAVPLQSQKANSTAKSQRPNTHSENVRLHKQHILQFQRQRLARHERPDAFRGAGKYHVARLQGELVAHVGNQRHDRVEHIVGVAGLLALPIDIQSEVDVAFREFVC